MKTMPRDFAPADILVTVVENGKVSREVLANTTIANVFLDYAVDFPWEAHKNFLDSDMLIDDNMFGPCVLHWASI